MYQNYAKLRDSKGLTDYKVSKATGLSRSLFSDWKKGKSSPKTDKLLLIADFFNVPLEQLVR